MPSAEPEGLLAARLVEAAMAAGQAGLIMIARSDGRAARLTRAARALAPEGQAVHWLPAWDCLPYDRVSPSREVMGLRMAAASAPAGLLIGSAEAFAQRLPRPDPAEWTLLATGGPLDPDALRARLARLGYALGESVDAPGEAVIHGGVVDVFPPDATNAWRIRHDDGVIEEIAAFDTASQRSLDEAAPGVIRVGPASEYLTDEARPAGIEHSLTDGLVAPLDLLPEAAIWSDPEVAAALPRRRDEVADAFAVRLAQRPLDPEGEAAPAPPATLHLDEAGWNAALAGREPLELAEADAVKPPRIADAAALLKAGRRVVLAGPPGPVRARIARRLGNAEAVADWPSLLARPPGTLATLDAPAGLPGFVTPDAALIPLGQAGTTASDAAAALLRGAASLEPGDAVIHLDHGLGALEAVEAVEAAGVTLDCLRLRYADGTRLVPFGELDRLWRYGARADSVTLDRLNGEAWLARRHQAQQEVTATADALSRLAAERQAARAPAIEAEPATGRRLAAGFRFDLTADQQSAIDAVMADLAAGRPMDRLVCGDVGFGKTEVAIRAAAVAALAGHQVALLAPTTVLVRQHLHGFRRRLAPFGLRVEALSRLTPPAEAREIKAALARGDVHVVIGTQALAGKGIKFRDLALLIIDEEQRFGARQKAQLMALRDGTPHLLTLTATPIPRTLQTALVGLRQLSVIATAPALRRPVRTMRARADDALLAQALRREAARGGQSFCVCPRIEDIAPLRERLERLVPELSLTEAHGGLPAPQVDEAMVAFAEGRTDVLLSTNIVESGLDVPRANTMLVWRAERFGLSQLHQLRGRVGRGRPRGVIWLLADPGGRESATTERRLRTLEALDRVGAGFAISARDLDLRGAGDMLGERQAGHLRLVGVALYGHLLERALAGTPEDEWSPEITLGLDAHIPADHVTDPAARVALHGRLAGLLRGTETGPVDDFADELEDRFGEAPEPLTNLLAMARLAVRSRAAGIAKLEAGPNAVALTPRGPVSDRPGLETREGRLLLRRESTGAARLAAAGAAIDAWLGSRRADAPDLAA